MGILKKIDVKSVALLALVMVGTFVNPAFAQDLSPITQMLTNIGNTLTGPLGIAAGLVALGAVGLLFMTGKMHWGFAGSVLLGMIILYSAATILAGMTST